MVFLSDILYSVSYLFFLRVRRSVSLDSRYFTAANSSSRVSCLAVPYLTLSPLAWNNWTHRIQTPVTYLPSPYNLSAPYLHNFISVQPPLSHSAFICRHPCSATSTILATYNWSFLSICFTFSLESTPYFSPSTSSHAIVDSPFPAPATLLPP